jgi:hypothetical protein
MLRLRVSSTQCRTRCLQVDTRITTRTIEIFHRGKAGREPCALYGGPRHGTLPDHMPRHRRYANGRFSFARQA